MEYPLLKKLKKYKNIYETKSFAEILKFFEEGDHSEQFTQLYGLISPETGYLINSTVFHSRVLPYKDNDNDKFGDYCLFTITFKSKDLKKNPKNVTLQFKSTDKTFNVYPRILSFCGNDFLCTEHTGTGFYDCNRTYFHFDDDNTTGEGDFMHYKCRFDLAKVFEK